MNRQIDMTENINLPKTIYAGGNKIEIFGPWNTKLENEKDAVLLTEVLTLDSLSIKWYEHVVTGLSELCDRYTGRTPHHTSLIIILQVQQ